MQKSTTTIWKLIVRLLLKKRCHISAIDHVTGDVSNDVKQKILTQVSYDPNKTIGQIKDFYLVLDLPDEVCLK